MGKQSILVSSIGGDIGASAARSVQEAGYTVIGCDANQVYFPQGAIDKFYQVPPASRSNEFLRKIKEIIDTEHVAYFIPISEDELRTLNAHREWLGTLNAKVLIHNEIVLDHFLDKLKTIEYLKSIGIAVPQTVLLSQYNNRFKFPFIVKARTGCGSKRIWKVENDDDLEYLQKKNDGEWIAQEYVGSEDEEYTTGVFSDGKNVSVITFHRKLGFGGVSVEADYIDMPFMEDLANKIVESTNLVGSINVQSRKVGDVFIPFEINPRLSSTLLFRKRFGFDDCNWWIDIFSGKHHTYKKPYNSGKAIRYLSEFYLNVI